MSRAPYDENLLNERLTLLRSRISTALVTQKTYDNDVNIIAVGKGHTSEALRQLYNLGLRNFAENYGQEFLKKYAELRDLNDIQWHFIGSLQSNKARKIAETGCLIHSVDRLSLLNELIKSGAPNQIIRILIQLQIDSEDKNKSGCTLDDAHVLCSKIIQNPYLSWEGFMGIGPANCSPERLQILYENFMRRATLLWETYSLRDPSRKLRPMTISLGMSDDLEIAIRCGATHVRIGTALLGPRQKAIHAT